jgi:hypothetical protein
LFFERDAEMNQEILLDARTGFERFNFNQFEVIDQL